jgi:hypothetical protein
MELKRWISGGVIVASACGTFCSSWPAPAQKTVIVRAVVTATTGFNEAVPAIPGKSIIVDLGRKPQSVFDWMPLRGTRAGLQLAILINNPASPGLDFHLNDIEKFIEALPTTTQVTIGYMQNGRANIPRPFTNDHDSAVTALWLPVSTTGAVTNRYRCLSDLIKRWPGGNQGLRREVIMITDDVEPASGWASDCADEPNVQAAISDAQQSDVVVYSIIFTEAGLVDVRALPKRPGENYLVQVSNATGGKAYSLYDGYQVTLAAFLFDILCKLDNQYELTFKIATRASLQHREVKSIEPSVRLRAPAYVSTKYPVN